MKVLKNRVREAKEHLNKTESHWEFLIEVRWTQLQVKFKNSY